MPQIPKYSFDTKGLAWSTREEVHKVIDINAFRERFGGLKPIGNGGDSTVFIVERTNQILKIYDGLRRRIPADKVLEVLKQYKNDTVRVKEFLLNYNPESKLNVDGADYDICYVIVKQGHKIGKIGGTCYSLGQEVISGSTLLDFFEGNEEVIRASHDSHAASLSLTSKDIDLLKKMNEKTSWYINDSLNLNLWIRDLNIKPKIDLNKKILSFLITDLGDGLYLHYIEETPLPMPFM